MQPITAELADILKSRLQAGANAFGGRIVVDGVSYPYLRAELDKSERMGADQATVDLSNEDLSLGWGSSSVFATNMQIEVWQWYGDPANEVRTFRGLLDEIHDHRDFLVTTLTARSRIALLVDPTFSTTGPQGADETGAVRTADNGVYLSMEVSDIVSDLLDRDGWPSADRAITATSMVVDEFDVADGESYRDAIARLAALVGFDLFDDENGVAHFEPTPNSDIVSVDVEPVYTFRSSEDVTALDDVVDQYDLRTRVKVRGTLVTQTIRDSWTELWRTSKIRDPVGIWFDPSDPGNIRVLDHESKKIFKLRQSDRTIVSSVYIGDQVAHPLGISGDPADASIYWVLGAPWIDGGSGGNTVRKFRKSDNVLLATYSLPDGHWSAIKVSATWMWLTNLSTDRFYRRNKADATASDDYRHTYNSVLQSNPSGLMVDGTTLHLFWANGGTTARFLECDESDPETITKVVKTAGTTLHGGEMDTTTHTECWGDSDSEGLVAKFSLVTATTDERPVAMDVGDIELEDELGELAGVADRVHDLHPDDPAHPWEARRETVTLDVLTSEAQAAQVGALTLAKLARRRHVLDVPSLGNPAIQKNDLIRVEDAKTGLASNWILDTYRTEMGLTYEGTLSLVKGGVANETVTEDPPASDASGPLQHKSNQETGGAAAVVTLDDPPTPGNLLVLCVAHRAGAADAGGNLVADGWTQAGKIRTGAGGTNDGCGIFYRTVAPGDPAAWTVADIASQNGWADISEWPPLSFIAAASAQHTFTATVAGAPYPMDAPDGDPAASLVIAVWAEDRNSDLDDSPELGANTTELGIYRSSVGNPMAMAGYAAVGVTPQAAPRFNVTNPANIVFGWAAGWAAVTASFG